VQWRDANRFVYVPLEINVASHAFYEYDTRTNLARRLTDPQATPFKIANGDWHVSPDGNKIVFLNAQDLNLWLWEFPNE
jgi:Tol biopolymer transport system component